MSDPLQNDFLKRFEVIRGRMRKVQLATAVSFSLLFFVAAVIVLAGIDYQFELDRTARISLLVVLGSSIGIWLLVRTAGVLTEWNQPRTALELETRFPQIGQRVRTTVQFAGDRKHPDQQGVTATLVEALETDTAKTVEPIRIERVVPVPRLAMSVVGLAALCIVLALSGSRHREWRTALRRAMLDEVAYTTLQITPGGATVDEGAAIKVSCDVEGRRRRVVLYSKPANEPEAEWIERVFEESAAEIVGGTHRRYSAYFSKITSPMLYRAQAGPVASGICRIDVQYPIAITSIKVEVTPPEYTGRQPRTVDDGNLAALAGSRAAFQITLDRRVESAKLILTRAPAADPDDDSPRESTIPLQIDGTTLSMETELTEDFRWSVIAESDDGTSLPVNIFRVRVRKDHHPRVSFVQPSEQLLVHTLAEVLMKIRASDDYGLSRSGIVFQVNNDEEHTLLQEDFAEAAGAASELERTGRWNPRTRTVLEKTLPLEYFSLTPKDCVVYYAFAEDNFPDGPQRTESELRFIDIRPFRATYLIPPPGGGGGGGGGLGGQLFATLEELIYRQRFLLNRTIRQGRRPDSWGEKELNSIDRLIDAQQEIADITREFADGLVDNTGDDFDALFQAEAAMLNAVDSLSVGKFDAARLQEKDAQQYLVETRDLLADLLSQGRNNAALQRALALLDSELARKLRGEQGSNRLARRLVERLMRLANEEREVNAQLSALARSMRNAAGSDAGKSTDPDNTKIDSPQSADDSSSESSADNSDKEPATQDKPDVSTSKNEQMNLEQLESRQYDVVTEAQDLQRILSALEDITDLVGNRIDAATSTANGASVALAAGDTEKAAGQTADAAEMFDELARHLLALSGREAARRVLLARNIATEIAVRQRVLAKRLSAADSGKTQNTGKHSKQTSSGKASDGEQPGLGGDTPRAESSRIAERARTLDDVLRSIAESNSVEDGDAADRVAEMTAEQKLTVTIERTIQFPDALDTQPLHEVIVEAKDLADRMEVAAASLERLYRLLVTPRIQKIRELEERAVALRKRLYRIENRQMLPAWYQSARELINDLGEARLGGRASADFDETINDDSGGGIADWKPAVKPKRFLRAPSAVRSKMNLLVEELQQQLQELVLTDLLGDRDQATPPQYQRFVERYLKVLSENAPQNTP